MGDKYDLRLYDETLVEFVMTEQLASEIAVTITQIATDRAEVMPIGFDGTCEWLVKWLNRRIISKNRAYVHNILNTMGVSLRNTKGIIDICKGLSLNDSYWVVPSGFDGKFSEFNLYENRFSEVLALTALTGESLREDKAQCIRTSPEFTTNGMLPKAWRYRDGKIILFKGGIWRQYAQTPDPLEPFSEFYAAQIAETMGLNPVSYGLSRWKGILGSTCELFTDIDTAYVPIVTAARAYYKSKNYAEYYSACATWYKDFDRENNTQMYDYFASILIFDSLILNEDRHLGNFGVLRDNKTGQITGNAPIFDNGISLFNYSSIQELRKIDTHKLAYANYFKQSFDAQAKKFGSMIQLEQLARLTNFKFKRHRNYNWDKERLDIIQNFVRARTIELMNIIG